MLQRSPGLIVNYIVGGLLNDPSLPPSRYSDSDWLIAEVDESDGTIDHFSPEITLLLNADWDHADHYTTAEMLNTTFQGLMKRTKAHCLLPSEGDLRERFSVSGAAKTRTFGTNGDFKTTIAVDRKLCLAGEFEASAIMPPGGDQINYMNGSAALAVLKLLSVKWPADVLSSFTGVARRQTILHRDEQRIILEDYAHHPMEMTALFESLRTMAPGHQLVVVFQPHRYSRTQIFKQAFVKILNQSDRFFLLPVYPAYEAEIEGGTTEAFVKAFSTGYTTGFVNGSGICRTTRPITGWKTDTSGFCRRG